jgi:hypothetical protein
MRRQRGEFRFKRVTAGDSFGQVTSGDEIQYVFEDPISHIRASTCRYCNGQIMMTSEDRGYFVHDENCTAPNENYSNEIEDEECSFIQDELQHCDRAGPPRLESDDIEGDNLVEYMKRRFERVQSTASTRRKMRPNISSEWIAKL